MIRSIFLYILTVECFMFIYSVHVLCTELLVYNVVHVPNITIAIIESIELTTQIFDQ